MKYFDDESRKVVPLSPSPILRYYKGLTYIDDELLQRSDPKFLPQKFRGLNLENEVFKKR